jgi:transcriptional regulator with GAF, ATPase, and Fis domain
MIAKLIGQTVCLARLAEHEQRQRRAERVGVPPTLKMDVRVIAATTRDLQEVLPPAAR